MPIIIILLAFIAMVQAPVAFFVLLSGAIALGGAILIGALALSAVIFLVAVVLMAISMARSQRRWKALRKEHFARSAAVARKHEILGMVNPALRKRDG